MVPLVKNKAKAKAQGSDKDNEGDCPMDAWLRKRQHHLMANARSLALNATSTPALEPLSIKAAVTADPTPGHVFILAPSI
ncbi:hypothetical protein FRC11_005604 [Ceratobasidium sp. 423]|nr:hypothetical protein FRC11_005604 [Ceratobasidium sp. 423]